MRKEIKEINLDEELKNINKNFTSNKRKHAEAEKKLTDLTKKKLHDYQKNDAFLDRTCFTGDNGYQNFLVFALILSSLTFDNNKKVTKWTSTGVSHEKIKPFDTNFELTMYNLANGRVILKLNNSVLGQKFFLIV